MSTNAGHFPSAADSFPSDGTNRPEAGGQLRTDSLLDGVLILLAMTVVQRAIGFGRAIVFCRWLPAERLGEWDMAFGFILLAGPLAVLSLPGTFERYVEQFRQQGRLRSLLRRTSLVCGVLAVVASSLVFALRAWVSWLVFGTAEQTQLVALLAGVLLVVVAYNYLISLVMALRNTRMAAVLQLANSLTFAVLGAGLLLLWRCDAGSVILAYGGACLVCAGIALAWLGSVWGDLPEAAGPMPQKALWSKLAPFAASVLLINLLANLFGIVDRYMIVHYSPGSVQNALSQVGQYHSSRVIPVLLVSVASLLAVTLTPHLSHDWEAGRRDRVSARLNLFLKLLALGLTATSAAILFVAPVLFEVVLSGKFSAGLAVLPWTLTYCSWLAMTTVAQKYVWVAEKARLASLAFLLGLVLNIVLNLMLLPRLGLLGAVLATAAANLATLIVIVSLARGAGFRTDLGTWVAVSLPVVVSLGPAAAVVVLLVVAWVAVRTEAILSQQEKDQIRDGIRHCCKRIVP